MKYYTHIVSLLLFIFVVLCLQYSFSSQEMFESKEQAIEGVQRFCLENDENIDSCLDISYVDINNVKQNGKVLLQQGYFVNSENMVEKIQTLNNLATATPSPTVAPPEFASDNIDATFHADLDKPEHRDKNSIWQRNKQGKLEKVYYADISNTTLYYDLSDYPYGPSSYVPNYEEATKLSYYSHPQTPEKTNISPKATDPPCHNPLFIYPTHNFPKLLDIPAYVNSLDSLDEINEQSEKKMKSYTKFSTLTNYTNAPTTTPTPITTV